MKLHNNIFLYYTFYNFFHELLIFNLVFIWLIQYIYFNYFYQLFSISYHIHILNPLEAFKTFAFFYMIFLIENFKY